MGWAFHLVVKILVWIEITTADILVLTLGFLVFFFSSVDFHK